MNTPESRALGRIFHHGDDHIRTEQEMNDRYEGLCHIDYILKSRNIPYILTAGTMLGAVRSNDFIQWDWNCSTGCKAEDLKGKEIELSNILLSAGFELTATIGGKCINANDPKYNDFVSSPYKHIRFNLYYKNNYYQIENNVLSPDGKWRTRPQHKSPSWFFDSIKYVNIRDRVFPVPARAEEICQLMYGDDWRTPIHKKSRNESVNKMFCITRDDRKRGI